MTRAHRVLKRCTVAAFPNHEANLPNKAVSVTQIILCPLQDNPVVLQDQRIVVDDLAGKRHARGKYTSISSSRL